MQAILEYIRYGKIVAREKSNSLFYDVEVTTLTSLLVLFKKTDYLEVKVDCLKTISQYCRSILVV